MKANKFFIVVMAMVTIIAVSVSAQPRHKMGNHKEMVKELNLTEQQQTKIEALRSAHQKKMVDFKSDLEKALIDMRDLKAKGNYSRNDFLNITDKISKIKESMAKERANHRMDVYEQLTADQKKIFDKMPMGRGMGPEGKGPRGKGMHHE